MGGHFDNFTQIISEFVDNAVANFEGTDSDGRIVSITIKEVSDNKVKVQVEDTGTGIKDFESAIKLGDKSHAQSPLNEHGFGLKHALATANPDNDDWAIYARTEDEWKNEYYRMVEAPYSFDQDKKEKESSWPGRYNGSGTLVEFCCSKTLFNTLQKGIQGDAGFKRCLEYLREDLGYIYSKVIEDGRVQINISSPSLDNSLQVPAVTPDIEGYYNPGKGVKEIDLGGGEVKVEYGFYEMKESEYIKYYKKNNSTNGVEIRVNGRVLESNLFKEVWNLENHPTYNRFLVIVNIKSDSKESLPRTRTSKNGIREGDEKFEKLLDWITDTKPKPEKETAESVSERELIRELKKQKESHIRSDDATIETEFEVFSNLNSPVKVDLYLYDGNDVVLYEAKKEEAGMQDLYQLLMYWDGAVADSLTPDEGILLASTFAPGVEDIIEILNSREDENGNVYNFTKKKWIDEGIDIES